MTTIMMMRSSDNLLKAPRTILAAAAIASSLWCASIAQAQRSFNDQLPAELEGVDVIEHLGDTLPLDLSFINAAGETVTLGDYFDGETPVIITLNYYRCPMLCTLQLNGLVKGLNEVDFEIGEDYRIVTVSVDPEETPDLAALKKKSYVAAFTPPAGGDPEAGWAFLVSPDDNVRTLADAIGYGYRWNEKRQEWAHSAAIFIVSPDGTLTRYLYGLGFDPDTLELAITEGGDGKVGSTMQRFILWCFHYDDTTGQYTLAVMNIMRLCGLVTVMALGTGIFIMWQRERIRRRRIECDEKLESTLAAAGS